MEIFIITLGVFLDRITKAWASQTLSKIGEIEVIKNFFSLYYLENKGAAFGMLKNKLFFLSSVTIIIILAMLYYIIIKKPESNIIKLSFTFIISGAIGNLIDRLKYKYVIDFILLHYNDKYYFPVFNIADILVTFGTIILIIYLVKEEKNEKVYVKS